jgi:hypothetical protein
MKILLRVLTVLLVLGLGIGHWQLFPEIGQLAKAEPSTQSVSVEPLPLTVFCAGALVEVGGVSGVEIGSVERVGEALISTQTSLEELLVAPPISAVAGVGATAAAAEQSTELLSMIQVQAVARERLAGLAASYCQKPAASGWLLNGSAVVGQESVIIAANPTEVEALVQLEVHLPGRVITDQFALAPKSEQLIPTAGYANGEKAFAIYFRSSGPEISVSMQNRETRGLNAIGVEIEGQSLEPANEFVFAGLRPLTQGFENPTLRVYNPGQDSSELIITVFAEDNVELLREVVNPGAFQEIELEITGGYQLVTMTSTNPVLAAIKNPTIEPVLDFAWIQAAELFTSVSLPLPNYRNSIIIANPTAIALELTLETQTGDRIAYQSVVVAPFTQTAISTRADTAKVLGSGQFAIAIEILDPNGYSVIHPRQSTNLGNDLLIRVN